MNLTLKSIRLICVIIFYFSIFNSNLLALDYFREHYIKDENNTYIENIKSRLKKCLESKSNNFKDRNPKERMALIYLNTLLDNLLSNNKDILEKFGRSPDEFCVDTDSSEAIFGSYGLGLISTNLEKVRSYIEKNNIFFDSHLVGTLAHELAHDLLNHMLKRLNKELEIYDTSSFKDKYKDINEYNFDERLLTDDTYEMINLYKTLNEEHLIEHERFTDNQIQLSQEYLKWIEFYPEHPDFIKMCQEYEIAADNLGLKLYLNTGFKPEDYKRIYKSYFGYKVCLVYSSNSDIFKTLSEGDNYITEGIRARKEGRFNEFMESIQYVNPTDIHPSDFWRYWNARDQIEVANIDLNRGIQNNLYIKIDLSKLKKLAELKTFLSNSNNLSKDVKNQKDPRYYIIDKLLNYKKRSSLSYTLEFIPSTENDVGIIKDDNTILLKANDIFQIASITTEYQNNECILLFSIFGGTNPYEKLYSSIKKAFL